MTETTCAISKPDVLHFFTKFGEQICAGQPLLASLRRIQKGLANQPMEMVVADLAGAIEDGVCLSDAMARRPEVFNPAVVALVRAGEIAGLLDHILALIVECSWRYPGKVV